MSSSGLGNEERKHHKVSMRDRARLEKLMANIIVCTPKSLPASKQIKAAKHAVEINPANHPHSPMMARALLGGPPTPFRLAIVVARRWPTSGVRLTVGFLDTPPSDLKKRILLHMNAWAKTANV